MGMEPRATAPPTASPPSPPCAFGAPGGGRGLPPTGSPDPGHRGPGDRRGPPPGARPCSPSSGGVAATAMLAGSVGGWLASSARRTRPRSAVAVDRASLELDGDSLDVGEVLARVEPSVVSIETELATVGRGPWDAGGTATGAGHRHRARHRRARSSPTRTSSMAPARSRSPCPARARRAPPRSSRRTPGPTSPLLAGRRHVRARRRAARLVGRPAGGRRRRRHRQRAGPRGRPHRDRGHRVGHTVARSRPSRVSSTTSSRPTPPSARATRAARSSTRPARWSASTPPWRRAAARCSASNIGFAISIDTAREVVSALRR